jgi:regulator of ribonuclease activity A
VEFTTADLCDEFPELIEVALPLFREYGGVDKFAGPVETLRVNDDNTAVRGSLETPGHGRVLVVDNAGSLRCALLGGRLAGLAESNGWSGVVINGCVRDLPEIRRLNVGVRALSAMPRRSSKNGSGERGVTVSFAGTTFAPGHFVYADSDGILVARRELFT